MSCFWLHIICLKGVLRQKSFIRVVPKVLKKQIKDVVVCYFFKFAPENYRMKRFIAILHKRKRFSL